MRVTSAISAAEGAVADGTAAQPSPSTEDQQENAKDTQLPPTNAAGTGDANAAAREQDAISRKAAAQDMSTTADVDAVGGPSNGESDVNSADAAATGASVDPEQPTAPNDSWNSVDDNVPKQPREVTANDPNVPADGEPVEPMDEPTAAEEEEEEFSIAGDNEENPATTPSPAAGTSSEEPIATAHPVTVKPTQAPKTTLAPSPSPMVMVEVTSAPSITPAPATTKPLLRTETNNAAVASAGNDSSTLHAHLNQGSPLLLISFAVICCGFLILWVRKRKINGGVGSSLSDGGAGGSSASSSSSKVQYSRIENKKESLFEEDDDDDDDDDDRGDNWEDWEGDMGRLSDDAHVSTNAYQSSLYSHPNPFAGGGAASPPMSPELVAQSGPPLPQFQFAAPPRLPAPGPSSSSDYRSQHNQPQQLTRGSSDLHEIVVSSTAAPGSQKATSPGSNSSSDSYEVVTDDPVLLHSSPFTSSKKLSPPKPSAEELEKQQTETDLFSSMTDVALLSLVYPNSQQFGMVPTFRKSTPPPPPSSFLQATASSSTAASHRPSMFVATTAATVTAASASALFAAEMEDLSIGAASDEWGEDDEWVQGI